MSTIVVANGITLNRTRSSIRFSRAVLVIVVVVEAASCVGQKATMLVELVFAAIVHLPSPCHSLFINPMISVRSRCGPRWCISQSTRGVYYVVIR